MKKYLYLSLFMNMVLLIAFILMFQSNEINSTEVKRIDEARLGDIKALEILLVDHLSKSEATSRLKDSPLKPDFFVKNRDDENGIGIGHLFLNFDQKNQLKNVEASSFAGP